MGVKSLWNLLEPVARPVQLESLSQKRLAIDASIWLYQFLKAIRDEEGNALENAHILGFFRRICKLLFFNIKPVFVFDGGAPELKRQTLVERRKRRIGKTNELQKIAGKILANQIQMRAIKNIEKSKSDKSRNDSQEKIIIGDDVVYYDELKMSPAQLHKKRKKDEYYLPPIEGGIETMIKEDDPRMATKEDLHNYIKKYKPEDVNTDSEYFKSLPLETQYEIISELRQRSRLTSVDIFQELVNSAPTAMDFSKLQIQNLVKRNDLTQKMLNVTNNVNNLNNTAPLRIASERNREYILIKNEDGLAGYTMKTSSAIKSNNLTGRGSGTIDEPVNLDESSESDEKSIPDSENEWEEVELENEPDDLLLDSNAYVDDDEPIESVMKKFNMLESQYQNSQNFNKQSNREVGSVDSLSDDQDSSKSYEPDSLDSLYAIWLSRISPEFQRQYDDHDERIRKAIYEWDDCDLEEQKALAIKRLGKLKEGDDEKEVALKFWLHFLNVTIQFRRSHSLYFRKDEANSSSLESIKVDNLYVNSVPSLRQPNIDDENFDLNKLNNKRFVHEALNSAGQLEVTSPCNLGSKKLIQIDFEFFSLPLAYDTPLTVNLKRKLSKKVSKKLRQTPRQIMIREIRSIAPTEDLLATDLMNDVKHTCIDSESFIQESSHCTINDGKIKSDYFECEMRNDIDSIKASSKKKILIKDLNNLSEDNELLNKVNQNYLLKTDDLTQIDLSHNDDDIMSISGEEKNDLTLQNLNFGIDDLYHSQCTVDFPGIDTKDLKSDNNVSSIHQHNEPKINVIDLTSEPDIQTYDLVKSDHETSSDEDVFESREEHDNSDEDTEQLAKETSEFARFLSELQNKDLGSIQKELTNEIQQLNEQQRRDKRDADTVTQSMINDCQKLLRLFGIPYVIAPMEAEAQCAELLRLKLVDGIITEDSDVFLFGGTEIYKNMFNQQKYVECYLAKDFEQELKLNREKLIQLAIILGSDYSEGLPGIGIVSAMELLNEFPGYDGLEQFKSWWLNVQSGKHISEQDENDFRKKFRRKMRKLFLPSDFPNRHIWGAYMNPQVDDSKIQFQWGFPDLDDLRSYLKENLSWSESKADETLVPLMRTMLKRQNERVENARKINTQTSLDDFFDLSSNNSRLIKHKSARIQRVVDNWNQPNNESDHGSSISDNGSASTSKFKRKHCDSDSHNEVSDQDTNDKVVEKSMTKRKGLEKATTKKSSKRSKKIKGSRATKGSYSSGEK
ncbi:PIN domain-like protein [Gigaspora margarita]|uniref:PIN domain-like protein n=1 Tax=Gigaspora margarita TaxID=4874 RepID=A0A8H3WX36_GIGMA|nr:PIN domain-like protein [Gigaspora margarita]